MDRPSLVVLDVGHGNAAVLIDTGGVIVVDAGKSGVLVDFLKHVGIKVVDVLLVSHADDDHVRNAPDVLLDKGIMVRQAYYNSDSSKKTMSWRLFRKAIKTARREKQLDAHAELTTSLTGHLDRGSVRVEVLFPPPELAASGPGGEWGEGERLTSNSMSAAVRLWRGDTPAVLLAGDMERGCLDYWAEEKTDPRAEVLVFPHHGGLPGEGDPVEFATRLGESVRPSAVLFSIHRSQYELPIPEVVQAVRRVAPDVRVVCTQLSGHCAKGLPTGGWGHLQDLPSRGRESGSCCAGSILIDLSGAEPLIRPLAAEHQAFIRAWAESPLCLG
jgi:beta-lactamase superfamily II metal-dependent hydrolase